MTESQRAEFDRRVAALERRSASGVGVSTAFGGSEVRATQVGFPAELTAGWSPTDGYAWKQLVLSGLALVDPDVQRTGAGAVSADGSEDLASGTRGWLEIDPQAGGWIFVAGGDGSGGGGGGSGACEGDAYLEQYDPERDCVTVQVDTGEGYGETVPIEDGVTINGVPYTVTYVPSTQTLTLTASISGSSPISGKKGCAQCPCQVFLFRRYTFFPEDEVPLQICDREWVRVKVCITCCDPSLTEDGWYRVVDPDTLVSAIVYLTVAEDGCEPLDILCGPYATREEAEELCSATVPYEAPDCIALWGGTPPATIPRFVRVTVSDNGIGGLSSLCSSRPPAPVSYYATLAAEYGPLYKAVMWDIGRMDHPRGVAFQAAVGTCCRNNPGFLGLGPTAISTSGGQVGYYCHPPGATNAFNMPCWPDTSGLAATPATGTLEPVNLEMDIGPLHVVVEGVP